MKYVGLIWKYVRPVVTPLAFIGVVVASFFFWAPLTSWVEATLAQYRQAGSLGHDHSHGGEHNHGAPKTELPSIHLSSEARKNLGLTSEALLPLKPQTFRRQIVLPSIVATRPGRTELHVATPLTGLVTHVHAVEGETVSPGTTLFKIRLTHEDLVQAQTDYLRVLGEREVEVRELERLTKRFTDSAIVPERTILEHEYARDKLDALIAAQEEALKLHGLSERQVQEIQENRRLLSDLHLVAPQLDEHDETEELRLSNSLSSPEQVAFVAPDGVQATEETSPLLAVEKMLVAKGKAVAAGENLCTLADYSRLFIEADAFEQDAPLILESLKRQWPISAVRLNGDDGETLSDLSIVYIDSEVDRESRSLHVYLDLKNEILNDRTNQEGQRFVTWKYRPGQRFQLLVPVEEWTDVLVVPIDAVERDGANAYVFRQNGNSFRQTPVHIRYRDQRHAVIEASDKLPVGSIVAQRSAHRLYMAIQNASGGGVDPHAGHNH
ncbi:MAG: efflux RND transporter periplasmic adaptor subunit [Planctomycetaceae bacterium]